MPRWRASRVSPYFPKIIPYSWLVQEQGQESRRSSRCNLVGAGASSPSGIHPFPEPRRGGGPGRQIDPCHPRQLCRPQASQKPAPAQAGVRAWLTRHPRWSFHFTPTSCSWANAVESFFATLTRRRLQRGVFHSLVDLQAAINRYLNEHNRKTNPFLWTADPDRIIEKVNRGYQRSRQTTRFRSRESSRRQMSLWWRMLYNTANMSATFAHMVRIYADPGSLIRLLPEPGIVGFNQEVLCEGTFSGQLVNVP